MMLNLLVSILGTIYESAQDEATDYQYQFRCEMIIEAGKIKEFFNCFKKSSKSKVMILQYSIINKQTDENEQQELMALL